MTDGLYEWVGGRRTGHRVFSWTTCFVTQTDDEDEGTRVSGRTVSEIESRPVDPRWTS